MERAEVGAGAAFTGDAPRIIWLAGGGGRGREGLRSGSGREGNWMLGGMHAGRQEDVACLL